MAQAAVFVDGGYLARILKDLGEPRIDYALLARWAAEGYDVFRTYYYDCLPYHGANPSSVERQRASARQRFFAALNRLDRFTVRLIHGSKASYDQDLWDEADERRAITGDIVTRMLLP